MAGCAHTHTRARGQSQVPVSGHGRDQHPGVATVGAVTGCARRPALPCRGTPGRHPAADAEASYVRKTRWAPRHLPPWPNRGPIVAPAAAVSLAQCEGPDEELRQSGRTRPAACAVRSPPTSPARPPRPPPCAAPSRMARRSAGASLRCADAPSNPDEHPTPCSRRPIAPEELERVIGRPRGKRRKRGGWWRGVGAPVRACKSSLRGYSPRLTQRGVEQSGSSSGS